MKVTKRVISDLHLCYSIAPLTYRGEDCFLVAAEKHDPCYLFNAEGEKIDTVWEEPGGVMTMQQVPGTDGQFLATHKFYSPNDSKEAKIVIVTPQAEGGWEVRTLCEAPFVHRFGILERNGVHYLIVCCLKSDHEYRDDWRFPGATFGAVLPEDLSGFDAEHPLKLTLLKDNMLKNHGFSVYKDNGVETAIVGCDSGVFQFIPPAVTDGEWTIRQLIDEASSDAILMDMDGDGKPELGSISPFHGDTLYFYRQNADGQFVKEWEYEKKCEMLHATWTTTLFGVPTWIVGNRKADRDSMLITWADGTYHVEIFEQGAGAANACMLDNGKLVLTNRETDEVAMYTFEEE